jgi:hypothetical protein
VEFDGTASTGLCLGGSLQFRFGVDLNGDLDINDLNEELQTWSGSPVFVDAPLANTNYRVESRCSTKKCSNNGLQCLDNGDCGVGNTCDYCTAVQVRPVEVVCPTTFDLSVTFQRTCVGGTNANDYCCVNASACDAAQTCPGGSCQNTSTVGDGQGEQMRGTKTLQAGAWVGSTFSWTTNTGFQVYRGRISQAVIWGAATGNTEHEVGLNWTGALLIPSNTGTSFSDVTAPATAWPATFKTCSSGANSGTECSSDSQCPPGTAGICAGNANPNSGDRGFYYLVREIGDFCNETGLWTTGGAGECRGYTGNLTPCPNKRDSGPSLLP